MSIIKTAIIRKLQNGQYRLYSRKKDESGKRRNLGTYSSLSAAKKREQEVQYFKHHDDDGQTDKAESALKRMSDIASYLEESGFIDASDKVYMAMAAVDGSLDDEDYNVDPMISDFQLGLVGSKPVEMTGEVAGGMQGMFSVPEAEKLASLADKFDQKGLYNEADIIDRILKVLSDENMADDMPDIISKLENNQKDKKTKVVDVKQKDKSGVGVLVDSNGLVGTDVTDNSNCGTFQGLSDAYFYSSYGNLEGIYGQNDR